MIAKVNVAEGLDRFGGYIHRAGDRIFRNFDEVVKGFPGDDLTFIPKPPPRGNRERIARDVDFDLF